MAISKARKRSKIGSYDIIETGEDVLNIDNNTLYVDTTNNRIGIGTSSPGESLDVIGSIRGRNAIDYDNNFYFNSQPASGYHQLVLSGGESVAGDHYLISYGEAHVQDGHFAIKNANEAGDVMIYAGGTAAYVASFSHDGSLSVGYSDTGGDSGQINVFAASNDTLLNLESTTAGLTNNRIYSFNTNKDFVSTQASSVGGEINSVGTRGFQWQINGTTQLSLSSGGLLTTKYISLEGVSEPSITFNSSTDSGVDFAIINDGENLIFGEPEDVAGTQTSGVREQFKILDDNGVDSINGYMVGGSTVINSSRKGYFNSIDVLTGNILLDNELGQGVYFGRSSGSVSYIIAGADGAGAPTSQGQMSIGSDNEISFMETDSEVKRAYLTTNDGDFYATAYNTTSDERTKTNIQTIENPLETLSGIRGVTFERTNHNPRLGAHPTGAGVIAQEVLAAGFDIAVNTPEVESEDFLGAEGVMTVEYNALIGLLIESVKAQQTIIDDLKARIEVLEG